MKPHKLFDRCAALLLALSLLLSLAACTGGQATATTMHLKRTEGTVAVSDDSGADVPLLEDLGLYSGYGVDTRSASYAWIDLDDVKLTKMDQDSQIAIAKEGKKLEIEVKSGSLFFHVTEPLEDDETMDIRTSTMLVGIRGTCGWVEVPEDSGTMTLYLLEGKVECSAGESTAAVSAGEMAAATEDGQITVSQFTASDVPAFVLEEIEEDEALAAAILEDSGLDVLDPPSDPTADALEAYRTIVAQADTYDYGTTETPTGVYRYGLVSMQAEHPVPALLLEQDTDFGISFIRVFQYDPSSGTVLMPSDPLTEGVGAVGGYRGSLDAAADGNGVIATEWSSGTGQGSAQQTTLNGESLSTATVWSGNIFDDSADSIDTVPIGWHDISDLSGLDSWTPGAVQPAAPDDEAGAQETPAGEEPLPTDGDRIVFRGTVNTYTYDQVLALQNVPDPNPGSGAGETYRLIVLDEPQNMSLRSSDPTSLPRSTEVSLISIGDALGAQYDGQHLIFSIDPNEAHLPSDASLPLGQPRASDIHVLN